MNEHPHYRVIVSTIEQFRSRDINIAGLQRNIVAIQSAIEGDMPGAREIRKALEEAENSIEYIWHMKSDSVALEEIDQTLMKLRRLIELYA